MTSNIAQQAHRSGKLSQDSGAQIGAERDPRLSRDFASIAKSMSTQSLASCFMPPRSGLGIRGPHKGFCVRVLYGMGSFRVPGFVGTFRVSGIGSGTSTPAQQQ